MTSLLLAPGPATATVLGDLTTDLEPGEWVELPASFPGGAWEFFHHPDQQVNPILQYANAGVWDPTSRQMLFHGEGHGGGNSQESKTIGYLELTDTWWHENDVPAGPASIGHAFDHNAIDPSRGRLFITRYFARDAWQYDIATARWSQVPDLPPIGITKGMTYFDATDTLIVVDQANEAIHGWRPGEGAWTTLTTDVSYTNFDAIAEYDHVREVVYFGGGGDTPHEFFELDAENNVRTLAPCPLRIDLPRGAFVPDPVTGRFIALADPGEMAEYDPEHDRWHPIATDVPATLSAEADTIAIPISTHGVIMYVAYPGGSSASVWLYRHAPSVADAVPPRAPGNLRVE